MQIRERKQIAIFCLAVALVAGFLLFRYLPLRKRMKGIEQAIAAKRDAVNVMSSESEQLPAFRKKLQQLQGAVGNFTTKIPVDRDLGGFLQKIAALMNKHNLKEQFVQPGKEIQTEDAKSIPVTMKCKGSLKHIFEFYKSLQNLDRAVRFERVELLNAGDFSGEVGMQTDACIYYKGRS